MKTGLAFVIFCVMGASAGEAPVEELPIFPGGEADSPMALEAAVSEVAAVSTAAASPAPMPAPAASTAALRGLHLTAWVAGTRSFRRNFLRRIEGTVINAVVVPVKETDGRVYLPGVASAAAFGTERTSIPRPEEMIADFKAAGLTAIARVVVFEDQALPKRRPDLAVRDEDGGVWKDPRKRTWTDPYSAEVREYNLDVAVRAAELGFDEVQFDYIRFPSDGRVGRTRFARVDHSSATAGAVLTGFLRRARERLAPAGVEISVAVFGLTTTVSGDMGIGQTIGSMAGLVDHLSPMMYPSHYDKGVYGLADPNRSPYELVSFGLRDARRKLGRSAGKLRPYFQDFSLGVRYRVPEVRAQIRAAEERGVRDWIFWNPQNRYTWDAYRAAPETKIAPPR